MDLSQYTLTGDEDGNVYVNCARCNQAWNDEASRDVKGMSFISPSYSELYEIGRERATSMYPEANICLSYGTTLSDALRAASQHEVKVHRGSQDS